MTRRAAACRYFEPELRVALAEEGLSDVALIPFKGPCESCSGEPGAPICLDPGTMLLAGRCARVPGADPCFDSCFGLLLGEDLVRRFLARGLHLLTPEMVRTWRENARSWGFTPETARSFFRESIIGFRVIDCGAIPVPADELAALAEYAGVTVDVWPSSLDHLRLWLRLAFTERSKHAEDDGKAASWRLSDFAMAYDLIGGLLARETEVEVGRGIVELFTMLCAPSAVALQVLAVPGSDGWSCRMPDGPPSTGEQEALMSRPVGNVLAGADGFTLCLPGSMGPMAHLWIGGIALPDRRSHYLQLGTMLAPVLGLALADSRRRNQFVAQEVALRTHLERALLGAIVDSSHDAIIGQDLEGSITTWNQGAARMFGYSAEEAIGRSKDLLIPHKRIAEDRAVMQGLLCGERVT
ncbi:MAG TPA: PAS domain S-box protein, partial [Holophaga sp.]|nr:PAS domain S-box protein [Holophaga sp.]